MTLASGADVSIDGVEYKLATEQQPHYVHRYESLFANSTAIAGEIAKQQLRPEKLLWSLTDFSGGEGSPIYYPQDPTGYDIGSLVNVTNAGLLTTRPRRRVTSVARSGSTTTTGMRPTGGSAWDKSVIVWGDNGLFSRDAIGWTAGTGNVSLTGANFFSTATDGRYLIVGTVTEGASSANILTSIDSVPSTPTYGDIFSGTTLLDAPFVVAVQDGVWYAWGIDTVASGALALIKGSTLSAANAGSLIYNSGVTPQGAWSSGYYTDMIAAEGSLFMSFGTPSGSTIYRCDADVAAPYYTTEPGFNVKKLVYKAGVLFLLGAQVAAGKRFASMWGIPLQTNSPIEIGSPRKHRNTELYSWEAGCAGPGSSLYLGDVLSGKIFIYDMKRDSFSLFDDLANGGTGDGMSFIPSGNLLSYGTSTMEATTLALTGWAAESGTVTRSTLLPRNGISSLDFGGAAASASTATGVSGIAVNPNVSYTASGYARMSSGSAAPWTMSIRWYSASGALISTDAGTPVVDNISTWTQFTATAISPTNAVYAAILVSRTNATAGDNFLDDVTFAAGAGTDQIAFLAMHGSRLFGAVWEPVGTGTSLKVFTYDDLVKENRDASQALVGTLESGEWDYGLPQEQKALVGFYVTYEVTDATTDSGLEASSRITISYATDQDIGMPPSYTDLDTITANTAVTQKGRHFIQVSDGTDTIKFTRLKVKITLDNDSTAVAPPIVYSVVAESQLLAYAETWDLVVRVEDEAQNDRPRSRQNDASFLRDNLISLAVNKNIVLFQDGARYRQTHEGLSEHTVMVEDPTDVIDENAEGYMRLKLRSVPT